MAFIGFGGWVYYYYFLIGATITKLLKEDIFGFGKSYQILNSLVISKHKFLILFISYFSEFFFVLIICIYLLYTEKAHSKKKNKYGKMESENQNNISEKNNSNKNKKKKKIKKKFSKQELEIIAKENENALNVNLINDDIISNKMNSSKGQNSNDINEANISKKVIPKRFELIHNDIYDDIREKSFGIIILSSLLLIINDVIIKWIFSNNEIFDYFFLNILIMTLIFKYHFKEKIYSHQNIALIIILFISGSLFVACLFEDIDYENKTIWEAFNENFYMVFIFIIIYFGSSICSCYGTVIQKRIMDYKFVSPYIFIFFKGFLGMIISIIIIIISMSIPCKENHIVNLNTENNNMSINLALNLDNITISNDYNDINFFTKNLSNSSSNNSNNTSPPLFECVDSYNGNTYFDNFFSYYYKMKNKEEKNEVYLELFLSIPVYCILHFVTNILLIFVNKLLSPIHCLIVDSLYRTLHIPIQTLQQINISNKTEGIFYEYIIQPLSTRILRVIAYFVSVIGYCIYLEIIELKFCGLNNNIIKNIRKRAKSDGKAKEKTSCSSMSSSEITNEERDEGSIKNTDDDR